MVTTGMVLGGYGRLELLHKALLGQRPDDLLGDLAVLEDDQRRERHHVGLRRGHLVLVHVELDDAKLPAPLLRQLLECRGDDAARSAPGSPEVDQDGGLGLEDLGLEVAVCDVGNLACHWLTPLVGAVAIQNIARGSRGSVPAWSRTGAQEPSERPPRRSSGSSSRCRARGRGTRWG